MPKSRFEHLALTGQGQPELEEATAPQEGQAAQIVQLNLKVSEELRQALRMKALRLGIPLTGDTSVLRT
ncbi:hypothetical protein GCM10008957_53520 [Deinococcus ruber]|uniref:Uncharacterized protein n=1 Tax=Deinococcus ruber TaxID=1848197 RepID=A0A918FH75_9DEIO|nr:hypothetical protein GCM10008957_53520 [Deinococcus ruber]